jgi:2-polyprenyl-6-methoxyphenol hydroxylase-like FAD-dependent oxidoreductase
MLYDTLPNKDVIRTGVRVVGVEQDENQVCAIMEDGSREVGDILIGADGIHSTVARALPTRAGWSEKREYPVCPLS